MLGTPLLTPDATGACAFFDRERLTNRCRVQAAHGEALLPDACHHFPRRALLDDRGTFVTLSHFCPTAASLLFEETPLTIVERPPAFPETRSYDGLDARGHWPPLVRADTLFDLDTYSRWEAFIVDTLERSPSPASALQQIAATAERLRRWTASEGEFALWAETAFQRASTGVSDAQAIERFRTVADIRAYARVIEAVPAALTAPAPLHDAEAVFERWAASRWADEPAVRRYLAAKAFGSWAAYEARGVRTLVAELVMSEMVLRVEAARACGKAAQPLDGTTLHAAIRAADWLLVHLVDRPSVIEWLGELEDS